MHRTFPLALAITVGLAGSVLALEPTPPQTEGPYYPRTKPADTDSDLTRIHGGAAALGEVLVLTGTVVDTQGRPIGGAHVEIWQTDAKGVYAHPGDPGHVRHDKAFQGYGTATSSDMGAFAFRTLMPAAYGGRPRHIHLKVTPPGGKTLTTQLYFGGDGNLKGDGIVASLGRALARVTLAPTRAAGPDGPLEASTTLVVPRR